MFLLYWYESDISLIKFIDNFLKVVANMVLYMIYYMCYMNNIFWRIIYEKETIYYFNVWGYDFRNYWMW